MKKKVLMLLAVVVLLFGLFQTTSAASITYYQTSKNDVPIRKGYSSSAETVVTISSAGFVLKVKDYVDNSSGNRWYQIESGSYGGKSLANLWVYSGNVTSHKHDYSGNGGVCKASGCGYSYPYSVTSMSALYQGDNSSGAKMWSMPYSTGKSVEKGTVSYKYVVTVTGKTTNADGNVWYKLSNGYWVYSGNLKAHSHDYSGNGGVCKYSGCGYSYPYSVTSVSGYYQGDNTDGAKMWSMPYSTGKSVEKGTVSYKYVVTVTGKTTNADGNVWYKLSNGYWVYSGNLKAHSHDCVGNGGVCKFSGCGYSYPYSVTSISGYYQGDNTDGATMWSMPYSTGKSVEKGTIPYKSVVTVNGKTTNADGNVWYRLTNGYWVYSGNLKAHSHDCIGNGGLCTYSGCGYNYPITTTSYSITVVVTNTGGAKIWSKPYSTGSSTTVRTASYNTVLSVTAKATNADGNEWYKLSDGNWVYPENVTRRYTITYNANGGVDPPSPQYKLHGKSVTVSGYKPTRVGYIFKFWCSKSDGSGDQYAAGKGTYSKNADATLYAIWEKCTSHDYTGGICDKCGYEYPLTVESLSATYMVSNADGAKIWSRPYSYNSTEIRTSPVNTNLTVTGKTTNQAGNVWYKLSDGYWVYSGNVKRSYKVNYVLNGGTNNSGNPNYFYVGQNISLKNPTRTGYTFAGWYTDSSLTKVISKLNTAGAVTIYAKWTANTYTIAFKGNGSTSGSMGSKSASYGSSVTLPSNAFKKTDYTFAGWNTKADGSGASYANGASVSNLSATNGATVTLYAQWKLNKPSITTQPASTTVTEGGNATFKVAASSTGLSYQWQYSSDGGSTWRNSPAAGSTTATLTVEATMDRSGYQYRCVVKNSGGSVTSNAATLTVKMVKPTITSQPASVTAAAGSGSVTFKVTVSGSSLSYQWQVSTDGGSTWADSPATGNKTATLTVPVTADRNGLKYRCIVKNSVGSATSNAATLTVTIPKPTITTQPSSVTAKDGSGNVTFKVVASGTSLSYQWQVCEAGSSTWKDSPATGNKTATLTVPATADRSGYKYRCVVKNSGGSVTSSAATLTVTGVKPTITTQPSSVTAKDGSGNVTFKVVASGSGLSYQWQVCEAGSSTWKDSPATGNKTATLTVPATADRSGYKYRCVVKNSAGSVTSSAATLTVTAAVAKPTITTQPSSVTAKDGSGSVTFKVVASGTGLSYQWQVCEAGSSTWKDSPATGNKTATLTVPATADRSGYKYRCVVKNSAGSVTSSAATLTVTAAVAKPTITTQPSSVTAKDGSGSVTFKVAASGTGLSYQWQVCEAGSSTWKDSPATGNKTATLTVPATADRSGYKYRCVVKNSAGSVTSSAATLTVTAAVAKPTITTQPKDKLVSAGGNTTFTVAASGSGLSYQWQVSTDGGSTWSDSPATGNKTASLTIPVTASRSGYKYRCIVKNSGGSVISYAATLTVFGV